MFGSQKTTEVAKEDQELTDSLTVQEQGDLVVINEEESLQYPATAHEFIDGVCNDINEIADGIRDLAGNVVNVAVVTGAISTGVEVAWQVTHTVTEKCAEQAFNAGNTAKGAILYLWSSVASNEAQKAEIVAEKAEEIFADALVIEEAADIVEKMTADHKQEEPQPSNWWPKLKGW